MQFSPWIEVAVRAAREAGGAVTGLDGSPYVAQTRSPLATNGLLHRQMMAVLAAGGRSR
jgi:fructose-1,6-bisphosphatase/inositol monophosphatase family enzyme